MSSAEQAVYFLSFKQKKELVDATEVYCTIETYGSNCDVYTRLHFHNKKRGDFDKCFTTFKVETLKEIMEKYNG
jgi:hypothetical protein